MSMESPQVSYEEPAVGLMYWSQFLVPIPPSASGSLRTRAWRNLADISINNQATLDTANANELELGLPSPQLDRDDTEWPFMLVPGMRSDIATRQYVGIDEVVPEIRHTQVDFGTVDKILKADKFKKFNVAGDTTLNLVVKALSAHKRSRRTGEPLRIPGAIYSRSVRPRFN